MQITMFRGLLPLTFPDAWVANIDAVKFAVETEPQPAQMIDFRANGGKAVRCWIEHRGPHVRQNVEILAEEQAAAVKWAGAEEARFVESRRQVALFGQSARAVRLT